MKKLSLIILMVASISFSYAQTQEGGWVVGASSNLSFSSTSMDGIDDNRSTFNLSAQAGYFLMDDLAAGLSLGASSSKLGDFKNSSSSIGPFARYYVNGIFYVGAGYSFVSSKSESGSTTVSEFDGGNLSIEAGYPIWIVESIAVEPGITYSTGTGDVTSSTLALAIGFRLYFQ